MTETATQSKSSWLGRIETHWSMIAKAHGDNTIEAGVIRNAVLGHYIGPVFRYLLGAVRHEETAEDLSHEFALRLLRGDFRKASPDHGRFRDYLKRVLINLVNDHFRMKQRSPEQFAEHGELVDPGTETPSAPKSFEECIHDHLLTVTWDRLEEGNARYYAVLLARVESPETPAAELVSQVEHALGCEMTSATFRKTLARARMKYARILVQVVRETLGADEDADVRRELKSLGLLSYCEMVLE
ncbi:MAG: sigma factor [Planctomycetota bacterium]|nr:sigma factor [Planctomycetota bacterium]